MTCDPRYDILFEAVPIGPVTAPNRFYQVPHCNGLGHMFPQAEAHQRGVKAEGGWGVVSTQEVEIHPSSEVSPFIEGRLWDEEDARHLALTAEAVHRHGALAAIEITHNGHTSGNLFSRLPPMGVSATAVQVGPHYEPQQPAAMTRRDIAAVRRWHRRAAVRARAAGFDIIYVYAGHDLALPMHFLSPRHNRRSDEYGGSLENRMRLLCELVEDTKDAVGDRCAVAVRLAVDELKGADGIRAEVEGRAVIERLAEVPDLWDVNISDWSNDSMSARFAAEGYQEKYTAFVKSLTSKPVVGVGRFTSPEAMVSQIRRGVLDFIGAARPSIADPYLPRKIAEGRAEDIRECIGCNICVAGDMSVRAGVRCTQNPTFGEEYRRGWHPERIAAAPDPAAVLIVGAGPAGLEAAMSLARRGCRTTLAEAAAEPGGRVRRESALPGLATWRRVADYRRTQLEKLPQVTLYPHSALEAPQVLELAQELAVHHIALATGARWRRDGIGRHHHIAPPRDDSVRVVTPDDLMDDPSCGALGGEVVIYDDDHYYMGGVLAEQLAAAGARVVLVTPAAEIAAWTYHTLEQSHIERRLGALGVTMIERHRLQRIAGGEVILAHVASGAERAVVATALVSVTARYPEDSLYHALSHTLSHTLAAAPQAVGAAAIRSVTRIGDCLAPGTIAAAVYDGHRFAREFGTDADADAVPFKREYIEV